MYRIFSLGSSCRLYQLSSQGWVATEGTNFLSLRDVQAFLAAHFVPELPDKSAMIDSYIAEVDGMGTIVTTHAYPTNERI